MKYLLRIACVILILTTHMALAQEPSLREKIGQMLILGFEGKSINSQSSIVQQMNDDNIGGVILFDYNYQTGTFEKNIANPKQVKALNTQLQLFAHQANVQHHRPDLPLIISVDYEGGHVNRLKEEYGFPATHAPAEVGQMDVVDASEVVETMSQALNQAGFNLDFAPLLDVNVNPSNPIIGSLGRSFSADAQQVAYYAQLYSSHFLQQHIECAYKHFPGHGSSTTDSHLEFVDVSETWQPYELLPYQILLQQPYSCGMIMTAHIVNRQLDPSGLPATLSQTVITELLRNQLHFKGVVISDDMQMKAISNHYSLEQSLPLAINAGVDMFIFGNQLVTKPDDPKTIIDIIEKKVKEGTISESRIDEAYRRIMNFKKGLYVIQ